jgi:hypothetical protein
MIIKFTYRIGIAAAVILLVGATGTTQGQSVAGHKDDEAARTIAACGKPVRDYTFPAEQKTRSLTYRKVTLWFSNGDNGWFFQGWGQSADDVPVLNRDVTKLLPCFAKVAPPALPMTSPVEGANPDTAKDSADFSGILVPVLWVIGAILYFVPWVVASRRRVHAQAGIIVLNLLLGWTILGWVGALIWAVSAETDSQAKLRGAAV